MNLCASYFVKLALMPPQMNLYDLCGDVMNMSLNDNEGGEDQVKSVTSNGF